MEKLLTISIAAYNVEKYMAQCLDSLIIPSMDKIEVLIQNDGSKDSTATIAQEYAIRYPRTFKLINKQNGGYGSTINNSLKMATGKYFKQLDGDDWFDSDVLETLVGKLEAVDAPCVYTPYTEIYEGSDKQQEKAIEVPGDQYYALEELIDKPDFMRMHALCFKTSLLREIGLTILEHCFYTDMEYVIYPLVHTQQVYVWDQALYCYRLGREGQSVSIEGIKKHYAEHLKVIKQLLSKYRDIQGCPPAVCAALSKRIAEMVVFQDNIYLLMGDKKQEMREFEYFLRDECRDIYDMSDTYVGKKVKLLRLTNYLFYPMLAKRNKV